MYRQNELLLSIPLALYSAIRIRSLIGPNTLKNAWLGLFALIAAGYPVAETLSHRGGGGAVRVVILAGYCALPLLLYLVMTVLAVDAGVGLLRLTGLASKETVRSPRFKARRLAVSLVVPLAVVVLGFANH